MNYYVITEEIFNTLLENNIINTNYIVSNKDKINISFCLKNIDNTKRLISTTGIINENIESFENIILVHNILLTTHQIGWEMELE